MPNKTFGPDEVINEGSDAEYSCQFVEATAGQPALNAAAITAITATLKNVATNTAINSRTNQDVRNTNGGVLDVDGTFTLRLTALDNVIVGTSVNKLEQHRLTFHVTYARTGGGTGTLPHEVTFYVRNLVD